MLGTERHESRRIDNQLRGRTGRQGDPGKSKFYICLEDDLLRIFAAERLDAIMRGLGIQEDEAIVHPWMNKALETSQRRVEQRNFEIRKNLAEVRRRHQRPAQGRSSSSASSSCAPPTLRRSSREMRHDVAEKLVWRHMPEKAYPEQWNLAELDGSRPTKFSASSLPVDGWATEEGHRAARDHRAPHARKSIKPTRRRPLCLAPSVCARSKSKCCSRVVDMRWREHLSLLDHLRSVIHLRGYAQRDPLNEFKTEAFTLFERMLLDLRTTVTRMLMRLQIGQADEQSPKPQVPTKTLRGAPAIRTPAKTRWPRRDDAPPLAPDGFDRRQSGAPGAKSRRNAPCPCGSGQRSSSIATAPRKRRALRHESFQTAESIWNPGRSMTLTSGFQITLRVSGMTEYVSPARPHQRRQQHAIVSQPVVEASPARVR